MDFAFAVLGSVSSIPSQDIGWEERLRNDLLCVMGHKTLTQPIKQQNTPGFGQVGPKMCQRAQPEARS